MADTAQIEEIVKQVLANMAGTGGISSAGVSRDGSGSAIPSTAHVAMLTDLEYFEVKEDRKRRLNSSHDLKSRMPSSA